MGGFPGNTSHLSFSPDGTLLLWTGSVYFTLHRLDDGARLFTHENIFEVPSCQAVFSPDGTRIAWTEGTGLVSVWEVADADSAEV
jgi:hypothetical protein